MSEQLLDAGVTWKVYNDPTGLALFSPLALFQGVHRGDARVGLQLQAPGHLAELSRRTSRPTWRRGTLPQVSWIHGPVTQCEHPATVPQWGENLVQSVLDTLTSNPEVWAHTLFILNYDENGGFFDHVPPPVPPAGTAGEYLTTVPLPADAGGCAGPVGLGFRVPFSSCPPSPLGGYRVAPEVFDHTSTLFLIEKLFGVPVPNVSAWRRSTVGRPDQRAGPRPTGATAPPRRCPSRRWRCPSSTRKSWSTP